MEASGWEAMLVRGGVASMWVRMIIPCGEKRVEPQLSRA